MPPLPRLLLLTAVSAALVACSSPAATAPTPERSTAEYPVTVANCGHDLLLDAPPKRVFLIGADAVPLLDAVGALGTVVARTGDVPTGIYPAELQARVDAIPALNAKKGATGGAVISSEVVLAQQPDLVIGPTNGVDAAGLTAAGVEIYTPPAYCPENSGGSPTGTASFDWVYAQVQEYGRLFGAGPTAATAVQGLKQRVAALATGQASPGRTAVALYVPEGGGTLYPYGAPSMATPLLAAAGYTNAYADSSQRVFEVNMEDLLQRDPDTIVLLYSAGDEASVRANFEAVSGTRSLKAVRDKRLSTLQFAYTDPPTPLSVTGAEQLARRLQ